MCAFLKFLKSSRNGDRDSPYVELRKALEKDHTSFGLGLKTLSYLLSIKSYEIPYGRIDPNDIWSYFNGSLPEEYLEFLDDLDKEDVESVLINVIHLLTDNIVVGLGPIISKLGFGSLGKEFYSRTVALLVNLSFSSYERFGNSIGNQEITTPAPSEMDSCEKVDVWRMSLLNKNLTFSLCRLTVAISIFGTEEYGLFESFNELTTGLLGLFDKELWIYVIGSFPTLCFDNKFLFSINSRLKYIEAVSDQYLNLVRSLIASKSYPYDYGRNRVYEENSEMLYVLVMCGWIDHLSNYVIHNIVINNQKGCDNKVVLNSYLYWLSNNLNNRVVMDMIYTVFKFDYKLCFETIIRLSYFNDNLIFVDNIVFKSDLKDKEVFNLLNRLDLEVLSKDAMSLVNLLNYMIDGVKGSRKSEFLRLWKLYLSQYSRVRLNLDELNKFLDQLLKYLLENDCRVLRYSEEHFNPDSPVEKENKDNSNNRGPEQNSNVDQVLLHRNLLIKLVEILGLDVIKPYRDKLISSIEEGYKLIKKYEHTYDDISKIEFCLFLIYFLGLKDMYPEFDILKNNDINIQYNLYLIGMNDNINNNNTIKEDTKGMDSNNSNNSNEDTSLYYNKKTSSGMGQSGNIDEDYSTFVLFYTIRRILKNHGKGYFVHLYKLTSWNKGMGEFNGDYNSLNGYGSSGFHQNHFSNNSKDNTNKENWNYNIKNNTKNRTGIVGKYMFKLLFDKYRKNILYNIVNRFPELSHESYSTTKFYIKNALVYFRIYDYLMWDIENKKNTSSKDNTGNTSNRDGSNNEEIDRKNDKNKEGSLLEEGDYMDEGEEDKDDIEKLKEESKEEENEVENKREELLEETVNKKKDKRKEKEINLDKNKQKENKKIKEGKSKGKDNKNHTKDSNNNANRPNKNKKQGKGENNEGDESRYSENQVVNKYIQLFEKVILDSLAILIKYDQLAIEYEELVRYIVYLGSYHYLKVLDCNYNLTNNVVMLIIESFKENYNDEQYMRKVVLFVIRLTNNLMLETNWNLNHFKLFEKLVVLFTKILRNTNYINSMMTHKQGPSVFKNLLVVANSITVQETSFRVNVNKLNLAVLDTVLGLNLEVQVRRPTALIDNSLRSKDFSTKELENILISSCGKFKITGGNSTSITTNSKYNTGNTSNNNNEDKLALGTLSVLDLLIYQSFSQIFGVYQELENKETLKKHFDNLNFDLNSHLKMNNNNQNIKESKNNGNRDNSNKRKYKQQEYVQGLISNQLYYWNYIGPQYMLSLQFIGKLFLGFSLLPQTKLMLISDYFFLYGSTKTNKKINKIKERFLTDNNLVKSESPVFMYEIYRIICFNSFL